jgi:splicing factor U2AF subunit
MLLLQFLNGAMRRIGLCQQNESPILNCRVNPKFAFVECKSIQDANLVLNLNGIPFLGTYLKVSRPSKYTGPYVPSKTWQELTNQPPIPNLSSITSTSSSDPTSISAAEEKISRELFIGNTTPEMTESMIREFLGKAMEQVGLSKGPGNPINACRVSGKFAFIELRSREEAENALNLNNIPYLGAMLRVGRPSKYTGPITPHGNWEDILAKYMSGELKLPSQTQTTSNPTLSTTNPTTNTQPTKIVQLRNMLTTTDLESESDYNEILLDTKEECGQFGMLKQVIIPKLNAVGATKIFLEYISEQDAQKAIQALAGRTFDGRRVEAEFFSEVKFYKGDYSD